MPVIQLRTPADYFGINEAPQQPLFQQTNALQRGADEEMKFFNQMVGLRQQRPLAQAQAIQNQYSTIFNNAEKLRLEQQAAREAEQAVSALAGLTPEVDDYITQRQEIQRQFPNAMLDPRVQRIVDDNDRMFSARQSSLAKQQQEAENRRARLFGAGATPQQVEAAYQSPDATAQLEFQLGKGGGGGLDTERYKLLKDSVENARKAYSTAYENMQEGDTASIERLKAAESRLGKLETDLAAEEDRLLYPPTTVAKETVQAPPPPPSISTAEPKDQKATIGGLPPEVIARLQNVPANELDAAIKKEEEALKAVNEVDAAWTRAKQGLEEKLKKVLPDKPNRLGINPLELFAQQVLQGVQAQGRSQRPQLLMGAGSANVAPNLVPVWQNVLEDIGVNPTQKVFTEPGKGRLKLFETLGTQDVNYAELVQDWAKRFLSQRGLIQTPVQENATVPREEVDKAVNFLNKKVAMPQ